MLELYAQLNSTFDKMAELYNVNDFDIIEKTLKDNALSISKVLSVQLNTTFSDSEKKECIPTITEMVQLARNVRLNGFGDAFKADFEQAQDDFLKTALQLGIDYWEGRTEAEITKETLQTQSLEGECKSSELLTRIIIAQVIIWLIDGENPAWINLRLLGILGGEEYMKTGIHYFHNFRYYTV